MAGPRAHAVRRQAYIVAALIAAASALAACTSTKTPHCAAGAAREKSAQLSHAAEAYAEAARAKEGDCAEEGTKRVADRQAKSLIELARAQAAEKAGDRSAARAAYLSAWTTDRDNASAAAGVVRLTAHPATVDPVWSRAQRLADAGYDDAARTEIVAVLRAHPDQVVPQSLTRLKPTPVVSTPPPTTRAAALARTHSGSRGWAWPDTTLVLLLVAVAGSLGTSSLGCSAV